MATNPTGLAPECSPESTREDLRESEEEDVLVEIPSQHLSLEGHGHEESEEEEEESMTSVLDTTSSVYRNRSLGLDVKTSCWFKLLIPLWALATHWLFYYGQSEPMWRLTQHTHVDLWINATTTKSMWALDSLGLNHRIPIQHDHDNTVREFTYLFAIQELWEAKHMPGKFLPRLAALLLVVFSGIWPHLKLILLNFTFWLAPSSRFRRRTLHWLSTLGKWSLADVLVVCVMVGVLHLDWQIHPLQVKAALSEHLDQLIGFASTLYTPHALCETFLKFSCDNPAKIIRKVKCSSCLTAVHAAYDHPDWTTGAGQQILQGLQVTEGDGGSMLLRVQGMHGIYAFCGAVILSILLSLLVDVLDHRQEYRLLQQPQECPVSLEEQGTLPEPNHVLRDDDSNSLQQPLLSSSSTRTPSPLQLDTGTDDVQVQHRITPKSRLYRFCDWLGTLGIFAVSGTTLAMVIVATFMATMERRVYGAGPKLLHDILGVVWTRAYSLFTLVQTTGAAGGWDLLLMGTFGGFIVLGPILRAFLCLLATIVQHWKICCKPERAARRLAIWIDFIGAFCAWEVFVIAVVMVDLLMPAITSTILLDDRCQKISEDGICLEVEFAILWKRFVFLLVGGSLLVLVAQVVGSRRRRADLRGETL